MNKLHLGCGDRVLEGWINLDICPFPGVVQHDLTKPLPFENESADEIYTEHFIEHLTFIDAALLLKNCHNVLVPGGKIRISTPDLDELVRCYQDKNISRWGAWMPSTPCQMMNQGMRLWGHLFVFNQTELESLLHACGYKNIRRVPVDLTVECRPDNNDLVIEAFK